VLLALPAIWSRVYVTVLCPSLCPFVHPAAACHCCRFAAVSLAGRRYQPVVKLLSKRRWIPTGTRLEGTKLEPKGPRAEVVFLTTDQGFSSIQGTLLGFYKFK